MSEPRSTALHGARAGVLTALALGVADAAIALRRSPASPAEAALFVAGCVSCVALAVVPLGAIGAAAIARALRSGRRARAIGLAVLGAIGGVALGFAAFSGSAMLRSSARPWLIAASTALLCALGAALGAALDRLATAVSAHRRSIAAIALVAATATSYAHAMLFVRLYPGLHAIAALIATVLALFAAGLAVSARPFSNTRTRILALGAVLLVVLAGSASMQRSQRAKARARQHAAFSTYVVQALARLAPKPSVRAVVDDDRVAQGPSLDLEGLDIVLVTVDALRWDHLGAYGSNKGLTPAIDSIAREGVVMERAYCTTPHTSYSLASLMTGKFFRGVSALGTPARPHDTIAGLIGADGYATAAFYPPAVFAVDGDRLGALKARGFDFAFRREDYASATDRVHAAIQWVESQPRDKRTLLWVHLFEPHESYESHPGARVAGGSSVASRYDSEVAAVDDAIGALRAAYARTGRRAAWFVTADHGEEFGEHGGRFHGTTVYEEQARVPFVLSVPGLGARRVRSPISQVDLLPTLLAGLSIARPPRLRGRDMGPLAHGLEAPRHVFASVGGQRMVTDGTFKLVCDVNDGTCELFDLAHDPLERNNLADSQPVVMARLRPLIAGWDASHARFEAEGARSDERSRDELPPAVERAIQGDRAAAIDAAAAIATLDARRAIRAVRALAALGVRDERVRAALATAMTRNASDLSLEAGVALARLGDDRGVGASRDALASRDPSLQRSAALGLATLSIRDGVPTLAAWLDDHSAPDSERDAVIAALRALRDARAFDAYVRLLEDPRMAPEGALALGELNEPRAIAPLAALARSTRYSLTRNASLLALAQLAAPEAPALFHDALVSDPPLTDPFAIARAMRAPLAGTRVSLALTQADPRGRTRVALSAPSLAAGPVIALLEARSSAPCAARVQGVEFAVSSERRVARVALRSAANSLVIERCPGLEISGALLTSAAPIARDDR